MPDTIGGTVGIQRDAAYYSRFGGTFSGNGYTYGAKGTSYAAAYVSAAAALLLAEEPTMTPERVCQTLFSEAIDICDPGWDACSGWGILKLNTPQ